MDSKKGPDEGEGDQAVANEASIIALAAARVPDVEIPALRKAPGLPGGPSITPALLKHADEQTVVALAAVLRALAASGMSAEECSEWGVIAAPRFLGRGPGTLAMKRYVSIGASSVSPLIIPTLSLHSMSGTISLALGMHGTNFGVGGSHGQLGEVLLTGLATVDALGLPGLWVVATEWGPEPRPDDRGRSRIPTTCHAVALGLSARCDRQACWSLEITTTTTRARQRAARTGVADLVRFLADEDSSSAGWIQAVPGLGAIALEPVAGGVALLMPGHDERDAHALAG